jgi:hypothetical protein
MKPKIPLINIPKGYRLSSKDTTPEKAISK